MSFDSGSDFMAAASGEPIWPIRSLFDAWIVSSVARLFGIRIENGAPSEAVATLESDELVVSLGDETADAAALYAHLTGRRAVAVRDAACWPDHGRIALVVTTPARLTSRLLEQLTSRASDFTPGLICAESDQLRSRVLACSAATRGSCRAPARQRIDIRPLTPIGQLLLPDREVLGDRADGPTLRAALAQGAGVLSMQTHSDGFDALLTPDLTLCSMDVPHVVQCGVPNLCAETGHCHRYDEPTAAAVRGDRTVFPRDIAARILILDSCSGLMTADSVGDPRLGLTAQFAANPRIGPIITSWEIAFPSPDLLDELVSLLCAGVPAGEAVHAFNRSPHARQVGQRFCIVGDPRVRLPMPDAALASALATRAEPPSAEIAGIGLLVLVAHHAKASPLHQQGTAKAAARRLEQALHEHLAIASAGWSSQASGRASAERLRRACLDSICEGPGVPPISSTWLPSSRVCEPTGEAPIQCFGCGECSAASVLAEVQVDPPGMRRVRHCPRCGVIEDAPLSHPLSITWKGHVPTLCGDLPSEEWAGRLLAISKRRALSRWWEWPVAADGKPVASFRPTGGWPPGLGYLALLFMRRLELIAFSKQIRFPRELPAP